MEIKGVRIKKPKDMNIILGQTHFIKSVEDIYEAVMNSVPNAKFGMAFCEASQKKLVRVAGTDEGLKELAAENALNIRAGHTFIILMKDMYPINIMHALKNVPEVCTIFCATANEVEVVIAENEWGRGILGVIDGEKSVGVEKEEDVKERLEFLRKIAYKLG